ncbi:MAG TPA: hypothetical protein VFS40_07045, partial [Gemmatimonadales bacterium]|nr:hypothetical protein [Gemmatimonadales bacterium]
MTRRLAAGLSAAVVVALAALFAWRLVTLYAAGGEPDPLEAPALAAGRALLADALRGDSAGVAARVGSAQPVAWLETALRHDSALVRAWAAGEPRFGRTLHRGDTTVVSWSTYDAGERCLGGDVWVALLDVPRAPRVVRLSSP